MRTLALLLVLAFVFAGCKAYVVKDETGTMRMKWSTGSVVGFSFGIVGILGGAALSAGGASEDSKNAMVAGSVFGALGAVSFLITTLASGLLFGEMEADDLKVDPGLVP